MADKQRGNHDLEKQTEFGHIDGAGHDAADFRTATRRDVGAECGAGTVSTYGWSVGDLRAAVREAEVETVRFAGFSSGRV